MRGGSSASHILRGFPKRRGDDGRIIWAYPWGCRTPRLLRHPNRPRLHLIFVLLLRSDIEIVVVLRLSKYTEKSSWLFCLFPFCIIVTVMVLSWSSWVEVIGYLQVLVLLLCKICNIMMGIWQCQKILKSLSPSSVYVFFCLCSSSSSNSSSSST